MSGFENKQSRLTALLYPPIDKADTYDPTFLGLKRKRRLAEPKHDEGRSGEGGKHIDRSKMTHDRKCLMQPDGTYVPETFKGSTTSTRFGAGFARRPAKHIGIEAMRDADNERDQMRRESLLEYRRRTNLEKQSTALDHIFRGDSLPASHQACQRRMTQRNRSTIFDAPATATAGVLRRQERILSEGLTVTKKDWSVKQQFSALDGY
jgi:hypothetical protein